MTEWVGFWMPWSWVSVIFSLRLCPLIVVKVLSAICDFPLSHQTEVAHAASSSEHNGVMLLFLCPIIGSLTHFAGAIFPCYIWTIVSCFIFTPFNDNFQLWHFFEADGRSYLFIVCLAAVTLTFIVYKCSPKWAMPTWEVGNREASLGVFPSRHWCRPTKGEILRMCFPLHPGLSTGPLWACTGLIC